MLLLMEGKNNCSTTATVQPFSKLRTFACHTVVGRLLMQEIERERKRAKNESAINHN